MKEEVLEVARFAASMPRVDHAAIISNIIRRGEKIGITVYPEDIEIIDGGDFVSIEVYWETEITFPRYTYYQDFIATAKGKKGL
jgi:hypothetical protein